MHVSRVAAAGLLIVAASAAGAQGSPAPRGVEALGDVVGVWQSDTTNGASALSSCVWTPQHSGVLCEQTVTTPSAVLHALNLYTFDPATGRYTYYGVTQPGQPVRPVPITIDGHLWFYGGATPDQGGTYRRTVNDFSARDSYTWRQESSSDGTHWTAGAHGGSRRVR